MSFSVSVGAVRVESLDKTMTLHLPQTPSPPHELATGIFASNKCCMTVLFGCTSSER